MPSEKRDAVIIFNPNAGRAHDGKLEAARAIFARNSIATELAKTDAPGAATVIAQKAVQARRDMVIVCGGDGTINEVVNGLAGSAVPMAILPAGTANVLAKELELPWNLERAARLLSRHTIRRIALGMLTTGNDKPHSRYFLSVGGAGPDGAIVNAVNPTLKTHTGTLAYWAEGFRQLANYKFPQFRVTANGQTMNATLVVVGRTKHYGGPFRITTEADLHGNEFELMLCTARDRFTYLRYISLLCAGALRGARHAHFVKTASVTCEPLDEVPVFHQVDGEPTGCLPAEFRIVPDALSLVLPGLPAIE